MKPQSVKELIRLFEEEKLTETELRAYYHESPKATLLKYLEKLDRLRRQEALLFEAYHERFFFENKLKDEGYSLICGLDEVGRGPLAGPVVCAAVILDPEKPIYGIRDSKKLSKEKRESLASEIKEKAIDYGIGIVDEKTIDRINILEATKLGMLRALDSLKVTPNALLIDALHLDVPIHQLSLTKGDDRSNSIGAASIIAKVFRDHLMEDYDEEYPGYAFNKHKGYGTREHMEAIDRLGLCPIHRKSFLKGR